MDLGGQLGKTLRSGATDANFAKLTEKLHKAEVSFVHLQPDDGSWSIWLHQAKRLVPAGVYSKTEIDQFVRFLKTKAGLRLKRATLPERGHFASGGLLVKLSTLPVIRGEKIVLQIIGKNDSLPSLGDLGFWGDGLRTVESIAELRGGVGLVVGDNRLAAMHSILQLFDPDAAQISTIEHLHDVNLPFANQFVAENDYEKFALRALQIATKRHADVIMVSEITDPKLAAAAFDAGTKKLVIAGLPLCDSFTVPSYLAHLGVLPYMMKSQLRMVINASLVATAATAKLKPRRLTEAESNKALRDAEVDLESLRYIEEQAKTAGLGSRLALSTKDKQITKLYTAATRDLTKTAGICEIISLNNQTRKYFLTGLRPSEIRRLFIDDGGVTKEMDLLVKCLRKITPCGKIK